MSNMKYGIENYQRDYEIQHQMLKRLKSELSTLKADKPIGMPTGLSISWQNKEKVICRHDIDEPRLTNEMTIYVKTATKIGNQIGKRCNRINYLKKRFGL